MNVQLPKRDRALCLFNSSILSSKISDALAILSLEPSPPSSTPAPTSVPPATDAKKLSLADLAALPLPDLLSTLKDGGKVPEGVTKPSEEKKRETERFMDGLEGKAVNEVRPFFRVLILFRFAFAFRARFGRRKEA
jgi:hypothetical protein